MVNGEEKFDSLNLEAQCSVILKIFAWINSSQQTVDLKDIGGSANSGFLKTSRKLSNSTEAILIEQSATGLYERRIDLLTV